MNVEISQILNILKSSPSVKLVQLRNREMVIEFLLKVFDNERDSISYESMHKQLVDFLEDNDIQKNENLDENMDEDLDDDLTENIDTGEDEEKIMFNDTYEEKARKHILKWTNSGFLTNYADDTGEVFYELSSHSHKTLDWIASLKKEEFVGTESKFNSILNQLKELVEYTNEDPEKRLEILEERKLNLEQEIQRIKSGENIKIFEGFEIIPRLNQINRSARELLSDFKEVEDNFKEISKGIYQKQSDISLNKSDILEFTFDALDELKDSQQGKSFYAFWSFILNPDLQSKWQTLVDELYATLAEKEIENNDKFLKNMKTQLYYSGQKVYKANDKMLEKLSRIIRENEASKTEATKKLIQEIKKILIDISLKQEKPDISFNLECETNIKIPFERKITFEKTDETKYDEVPENADASISSSEQLTKLFSQFYIDKNILRKKIKKSLEQKSQVTLLEVIDENGGLEKGLSELFAYFGIMNEFNAVPNPEKTQSIIFDKENKKQIKIPEIILNK